MKTKKAKTQRLQPTDKSIEVKFNKKIGENLFTALKKASIADEQLKLAQSQKNEADAETSRLVESIVLMGSDLDNIEGFTIGINMDDHAINLNPVE